MSNEPKPAHDPLVVRLAQVLADRDVFRVVIRGFAILEDMLEREITAILDEPLEGLEGGPFKHKLNLAMALRIVDRDRRAGFLKLAAFRNDLAHADREPGSVTAPEMDEIRRLLDPGRTVDDLIPEETKATLATSAALMVAAACMHVHAMGFVRKDMRKREREALQRELAAQQGVRSLLARAAAGGFGLPGPQTGPQDPESA